MGSSSSKVAAKAGKVSANAARKYPTRIPHSPPPASLNRTNLQPDIPSPSPKTGPISHPEPQVTDSQTQAHPNPSDPDIELNKRLQTLGPVQPYPTHSNSSTFNTAQSHSLSSFSSSSSSTTTDPNDPKSQFSTQFRPSASTPSQTIYPTSTSTSTSQASTNTTSTDPRQNPAVSLLTARYRLAEEADQEFARIGKSSSVGRQFLDVVTIREVLAMRDRGRSAGEIEKRFGLREGVVGRLGRRGVVGVGAGSFEGS